MGMLSGTGNGPLSDSSGYTVIATGTRFWSGGTRTKPMSRLCRSGLSAPIEAMMFREFGCTGQRETSWFQGLSGGKTWSAARILSASGVSKSTGLVIGGMGGRDGAAPAKASQSHGQK